MYAVFDMLPAILAWCYWYVEDFKIPWPHLFPYTEVRLVVRDIHIQFLGL
jgi:hypothetical protein